MPHPHLLGGKGLPRAPQMSRDLNPSIVPPGLAGCCLAWRLRCSTSCPTLQTFVPQIFTEHLLCTMDMVASKPDVSPPSQFIEGDKLNL